MSVLKNSSVIRILTTASHFLSDRVLAQEQTEVASPVRSWGKGRSSIRRYPWRRRTQIGPCHGQRTEVGVQRWAEGQGSKRREGHTGS